MTSSAETKMDPLHKALQRWRGPESILGKLRYAGYDAHIVYRECVQDFCKSKCPTTDLEMYWKETAKEYVSSAGSNFDLGANRSIVGYYRSPFLDELELKARNFTSQFPAVPSVHPCIHAYMSEVEFGRRGLYQKIRNKVEEVKIKESIIQGILGAQWTGYKRDLILMLDDIAELEGFEMIGSRATRSQLPAVTYGLRASRGLLFYFRPDNGVREPLAARLPIEFWIGYEKVTKNDFFVADFRHIVPGLEQYAYYSTAENAILGVRALLCAFGALARSF
jgi:hypothetical protein